MKSVYHVSICFIIAVCLLSAGCAGKSKTEQPKVFKTVTALIKKHGPGSFVADVNGVEMRFNTGRPTKYSPPDFRGLEGDIVEVKYYPQEVRGQNRNIVTLLKRIKPGPNQPNIKSPVTGEIINVSWSRVFARKSRFEVRIEGKIYIFQTDMKRPEHPGEWEPKSGDRVRIEFEIKPGNNNFYVYLVSKIEKI